MRHPPTASIQNTIRSTQQKQYPSHNDQTKPNKLTLMTNMELAVTCPSVENRKSCGVSWSVAGHQHLNLKWAESDSASLLRAARGCAQNKYMLCCLATKRPKVARSQTNFWIITHNAHRWSRKQRPLIFNWLDSIWTLPVNVRWMNKLMRDNARMIMGRLTLTCAMDFSTLCLYSSHSQYVLVQT